jgi:hypothetical protein
MFKSYCVLCYHEVAVGKFEISRVLSQRQVCAFNDDKDIWRACFGLNIKYVVTRFNLGVGQVIAN